MKIVQESIHRLQPVDKKTMNAQQASYLIAVEALTNKLYNNDSISNNYRLNWDSNSSSYGVLAIRQGGQRITPRSTGKMDARRQAEFRTLHVSAGTENH